MSGPVITNKIDGGNQYGIIGAGVVTGNTINIYNYLQTAPSPKPIGDLENLPPCPYPGLSYFGPKDAKLFFGRDATISRLTEAVGRQSFTALVGASGSGKSSVVLAGLAPQLASPGGWLFSYFRIGNAHQHDPFLALAAALVPFYVAGADATDRLVQTNKLAKQLRSGESTLGTVFSDCRSQNEGRHILLIADQFEEAFTLVADDTERHRFIEVLLGGFADPAPGESPDICLILTLRADFYGRALLHRPLADTLQGHVENLGPMKREELRTAIVLPAANAEVSFESGLVETLLDEVESKPGSLPLLQFALREMWERQEQRTITRRSYDAIGGVQGALARRAETIFANLTDNRANAQMEKDLQRLFTRLVTPGEGQEDTRRVVEHRELGDEVWSLAQRLAGEDNRLVVTNAPALSHETAELVHEALIRHWPRLTDWINGDRALLSWQRQIKPNLDQWAADPADDGPLLRGGMLAQAKDWLVRRRDDLGPAERAYIEASIALRRRGQQIRIVIATTAIAACFVFLLVVVMIRSHALRELQTQQSRALAAASRQAAENGAAMQGILLALEALPRDLKRPDRPRVREAEVALRYAVAENREKQLIGADLVGKENNPTATEHVPRTGRTFATYSPDGKRLLATTAEGRNSVWDTTAGGERLVLEGPTPFVLAAFNPADNAVVAVVTAQGTAILWNLDTGIQVRVFQSSGEVTFAGFDTTGTRLVTLDTLGIAEIHDVGSDRIVRSIATEEPSQWAAFSPDSKLLAVLSSRGKLSIWNIETGDKLNGAPICPQQVVAAAFLPDQPMLVGVCASGNLWRANTLHAISSQVLGTFGQDIKRAVFAPDRKRLAAVTVDGKARVWDIQAGHAIGPPLNETEGKFAVMAFSSDGDRLATAATSDAVGTSDLPRPVRIWQVEDGKLLATLLGHLKVVHSLAFSPDGNLIATGSEDDTVGIWDARAVRDLAKLDGYRSRLAEIVTDPRQQDAAQFADDAPIAFSPDGARLLLASDGGGASLWDVASAKRLRDFLASSSPVSAVAFNPRNATQAVVGYFDGGLRVWNTNLQSDPVILTELTGTVASIQFSDEGNLLLAASWDGFAQIWDTATWASKASLRGHNGAILTAAVSHDGKYAVTGSTDNTAKLWSVDGTLLATLTGHDKRVVSVSFGTDGRFLTASWDGTVRVWDVSSVAKPVAEIPLDGMVRQAAFNPANSRMILTTSGDGLACIWQLTDGNKVADRKVLHRNNGTAILSAAFVDGGNLIATTADDGSTELHDSRSGLRVAAMPGHRDSVLAAIFDPKHQLLATASADRTVRLWPIPPDGQNLIEEARRRVTRPLSAAERERFFLPPE